MGLLWILQYSKSFLGETVLLAHGKPIIFQERTDCNKFCLELSVAVKLNQGLGSSFNSATAVKKQLHPQGIAAHFQSFRESFLYNCCG